ncbi:uncharacterized protein LOC135139088 [Zophobas morio]|uniref:uncharacterized protein LOC135139088 n=1 Tax=Zophobas morio TaxID=2755281 RepID=UPI003082999A
MKLKLIYFILPLAAGYTSKMFTNVASTVSNLITSRCFHQLQALIDDLNSSRVSWGFQMVDATSEVSPSFGTLKFGDFGNFRQCINSTTNTFDDGDSTVGKYCIGFIFNRNLTFGAPPSRPSQWALCVPDGCNAKDVDIIGNSILMGLLGTENDVRIEFPEFLCQTVDDVEVKLPTGAILTIFLLILLSLIVFVSTLCDVYDLSEYLSLFEQQLLLRILSHHC